MAKDERKHVAVGEKSSKGEHGGKKKDEKNKERAQSDAAAGKDPHPGQPLTFALEATVPLFVWMSKSAKERLMIPPVEPTPNPNPNPNPHPQPPIEPFPPVPDPKPEPAPEPFPDPEVPPAPPSGPKPTTA